MRTRRITQGMGGGLMALAALSPLLALPKATAQDRPTLSGSWSASSLAESWTVTQWGDACGPRPGSQGAPGGPVQVREQGGELLITGAGRAFSTAECWEKMPGVARASHSGGSRAWRTRCASAPNDSRRSAITTTISATDSTISLSEVGDYTFVIKDTTCHATASRSRSFSLVHRDGESAPAASTPKPRPTSEPRAARCPGSGEPARLEVHPSRKLVRAGDGFAFRATVLDHEGCAIGARPIWAVAPGPLASSASIDPAGTFAVDANASEGTVEVNASVAGMRVVVYVDVASPEHYDAILALRGLDDAGEAEQSAVAIVATVTIGGRTALAETQASERRSTFVAIVVAAAFALLFAGLVVVRRGSRPVDEVPADDEAAPSRRLDRESTAPASLANPGGEARGKICPTCGERYTSEAGFCGKDATMLVPLN